MGEGDHFLSRFFGVLLGLLLYPIKSLVLNLAIMFMGSFWLIVSPFRNFLGRQWSVRDFLLSALTLVFAPIYISLALGLILAIAPFVAIYDIVRAAIYAVKIGLEEGLPGIIDKFRNDFRHFSSIAQLTHSSGPRTGATTPTDPAWPAGQWQHYDPSAFPDVQKPDLIYEALPNPEPRPGFRRLGDDELTQAAAIGDSNFKNLLERYKALQKSLDELDLAMVGEKGEDDSLIGVEDDIFQCGLIEPWLLFKQIRTDSGQWQMVLALTHIIDFGLYQEFRKTSVMHPTTRENLDDPLNEADSERTARYCLVKYAGDGYCAELHELVDRIRLRLNRPSRENRLSLSEVASTLNRLSTSFYGAPLEQQTSSNSVSSEDDTCTIASSNS